MKAVGIGDNFSFGAGGKGNVRLLKTEHSRFGLTILSRPLLKQDGLVVSSTNIRKAIAEGRVELAAQMLGRPYAIRGQVVPGDHRGRLLGFPTANLKILGQHFAVPAFGVYAGRVLVDVGDNPTFANQEARLEAHLFRFEGDLYGREVLVQLVARLRGEEKFPDLDRLQEQLRKDARNAQSLLAMEEESAGRKG